VAFPASEYRLGHSISAHSGGAFSCAGTMREMSSERMSLRDLFVATAFVAAGLALSRYLVGPGSWSVYQFFVAYVAAASLGAGLGTLFKKPALGALLGALGLLALLFVGLPPPERV
jgi:hypothetical protein